MYMIGNYWDSFPSDVFIHFVNAFHAFIHSLVSVSSASSLSVGYNYQVLLNVWPLVIGLLEEHNFVDTLVLMQ